MKKKETGVVEVISLSADDPTLLTQNVKQYSQDGIVQYGEDDNQFDYLIKLATYSTTHGAIIDAVSLMLFGNGLNVKGIIEDNDLRRVVTDFYMFGNAAIQVVNGVLMHVPVNYLRAEEVNEDGKIENYFYSTDWNDAQVIPVDIPNWELNPKAKRSIYYFKPYRPNAFYYNLPSYQSCLFYCELEEKIAQYLLNTVDNSFSVLKMVNFNNGIPDEESQRKTVKQIKDKTTGVKGDKVVVTFNEDKEHAAEIVDISVDNAADQYTYVSTESQNKILVGHKLTSPLILGIRDISSGFSSNADEMKVATDLFMKMQINPKQNFLANGIGIIVGRDDLEFLNEDIEEVTEEEPTELSATNTDLDEFIAMGSDDLEGFDLFDSSKVDYDNEDELDGVLSAHKFDKTFLSQVVEFVSSGTAKPNKVSSQDREAFAVRYAYKGDGAGDRQFCSKMTAAGKLYRKEDIIAMERKAVNPGFGVKGADKYDIYLYKGGARCHHFWERQVFLRKEVSKKNRLELGNKISVVKARTLGTVETNNKKVAKHPNDMKHKAFVTKSTMPADAKAKTTGL